MTENLEQQIKVPEWQTTCHNAITAEVNQFFKMLMSKKIRGQVT